MRKVVPGLLERGRITTGEFGSDSSYRFYGMFKVFYHTELLLIVSSEADEQISKGWEHVSISAKKRTPNWNEMCFVKDLFWDAEETVLQFHPPVSEYVNNHTRCLHLWKPPYPVVLPPSSLVGDKKLGVLT